jgi:hypothetical protein
VKRILFPLVLALPLSAEVTVTPGKDRIDVVIGGKPFTTLYLGGAAPKPYLHPLRAADGKIVTRHFPMEMVDGESRDHPHHRGLWFSHGEVNGINFWENEEIYKDKRSNMGLIVPEKAAKVSSGKDKGSIDAVFDWKDTNGKTLLTETRKMTFYDKPSERVIDFDIVLKAMEKVNFVDTKEGTFAIRLADSMSEKKGGQMVNAEGAKGMKNVWGKASPWVEYAGDVEGDRLGVAILDHPGNPKHPTFWHSRDYGLFAANIFGEHDFFNDKTRNGGVTIEPGKELRFRYRVIIGPANMDVAKAYAAYGK